MEGTFARVWTWLRTLAGMPGEQLTSEDADRLSALFRERYHAFKQLLAANSKALAVMAEMEQAAQGGEVFGMPFVRSRCTAAGVAVYRIVRHLDALAPGKYGTLFGRLEHIREQIQQTVASRPPRVGEYLSLIHI